MKGNGVIRGERHPCVGTLSTGYFVERINCAESAFVRGPLRESPPDLGLLR